MTRIRSTNVKFGDSFVLPIEKEKEEIPESPELIKLKEDLRLLNLEVEKAKERKETTCIEFYYEQGKYYKYSIQQYNNFGTLSKRIMTDEIFASFEDLFLFDGKR